MNLKKKMSTLGTLFRDTEAQVFVVLHHYSPQSCEVEGSCSWTPLDGAILTLRVVTVN